VSQFSDHPEKYAEKHGLKVNVPYANELQVDIDAKKLPEHFQFCLEIIGQSNPVISVSYTTSKSGNLHAYVELRNDLTAHERIALQAVLGSDPVREALTYRNTLDVNNKLPQFLFELKDAVKRKTP
jgi:hypothetical protein